MPNVTSVTLWKKTSTNWMTVSVTVSVTWYERLTASMPPVANPQMIRAPPASTVAPLTSEMTP